MGVVVGAASVVGVVVGAASVVGVVVAVSLDDELSLPQAALVSRKAVRAAMELNRFMGQSSVSPEDDILRFGRTSWEPAALPPRTALASRVSYAQGDRRPDSPWTPPV